MKKCYLLIAALVASIALNAKEEVSNVWNGSVVLTWDAEFETGNVEAAAEGRTLRITFEATGEAPQMQIYHKDAGWAGTNLAEGKTFEAPTFEVVLSAIEATNAKERGLYIKGQDATLTSVDIVYEEEQEPGDPEEPETLDPGETKVLWEGEETLSWNEVAEQPASVAALLAEKDQIIVTVSAKGAAEWPKVLLRDMSSNQVGDDILLNDVSEFPYEAVFNLKEADVEALKDGFKLCGDGVTVTKMVLKKYKEEEPEPEEPGEEYEFTTVWTGDKAISWNTEVYAGEALDTYAVQQDMLAGLAKDDSIKVFFKDAIEGAQLRLQYKDGDGWDQWKELAVTEKADFFGYKVESDEMAQLIADRGLVITGQGYHAIRIELGKPKSSTGIESVQQSAVSVQKVLHNGQLFIIQNGVAYTINGQIVK